MKLFPLFLKSINSTTWCPRRVSRRALSRYAGGLCGAIIFLFSAFTTIAFSQSLPQGTLQDRDISVKATIDKNRILIGEPVQLQLEAVIPAGTNVKWFATDTIPHFEFIEKNKIDSSKAGIYTQTFTITSFDSGRVVIPALSLEHNGKTYLTDSLPVFVSFSDFDPKQDYHDIKDIIEVKAGINYLLWGLIAAGVLLLALLIWYLRKRRRKKPAAPTQVFSHLSPLEEALRSLDELKQQQPAEKQFYTRLNDIIRWFVFRKTGVAAMQETNDQFILQIEKLGMPQDDFIALAQTLRLCDVVKFAKFIPSANDKEHSLQVIRSSVQLINDKRPQSPSPQVSSARGGDSAAGTSAETNTK